MNSKNPRLGSCSLALMDEVPPLLLVVLHIGIVYLIHGTEWGFAEVLPDFFPLLFSFFTAAVDPFDSYKFTGTCLSGLTLVSDSVAP